MKSVEFPEATIKVAEHQEEYNTLHAQFNENEGSINCCFELTDEEVAEVVKTKKLWYKQVTFGKPMHPMRISSKKEEVIY